jgi:hypothetical protein
MRIAIVPENVLKLQFANLRDRWARIVHRDSASAVRGKLAREICRPKFARGFVA